jgi:hypothetical protein
MEAEKLSTASSVPSHLLEVLPEQWAPVVENHCAWFIYDPLA